jgi:hypothetical protein
VFCISVSFGEWCGVEDFLRDEGVEVDWHLVVVVMFGWFCG